VETIYTIICVKGILNSLVNSLSIWQSEHGKKSMKSDPVKYKTVRQLLISDHETRRKWRENTSQYVCLYNTQCVI